MKLQTSVSSLSVVLPIWNFAHILTATVSVLWWGLMVWMEKFAKWWRQTSVLYSATNPLDITWTNFVLSVIFLCNFTQVHGKPERTSASRREQFQRWGTGHGGSPEEGGDGIWIPNYRWKRGINTGTDNILQTLGSLVGFVMIPRIRYKIMLSLIGCKQYNKTWHLFFAVVIL